MTVTPPAVPVPAKKSGISAAEIAQDIAKYGGLAVAVLSVVENTLPSTSVPASTQAVIAAIVTVLTGLLALAKSKAKAKAA